MSIEAIKLALEALKDAYSPDPHPAIKALEEALANHIPDATKMVSGVKDSLTTQQEQGEPVGYLEIDDIESQREYPHNCHNVNLWYEGGEGLVAIYTTPPQRTWVGLTDEEIEKCYETTGHYQTLRPQDRFAVFALSHAIEAKLKEKNT